MLLSPLTDGQDVVVSKAFFAVPLTPGSYPNSPWEFVKQAAVSIEAAKIGDLSLEDEGSEGKVVKEVIQRALCISSGRDSIDELPGFLDALDFNEWELWVRCDLSGHLEQLVRKERDFFEDLNGLVVYREYADKRRSKLFH